MSVSGQEITSIPVARNFQVGKDENSACANWLTEMARDMLAPIPFREVFVILATFLEGIKAQQSLWASPAVKRQGVQIEITPTAAGLQGMHEYHVSFPTWSTVAAFCPAPLQQLSFEHLIERPSAEVHIGCQVGKVYRLVLQSSEGVYAMMAVLLAFATQARRKSDRNGQESYYDRVRRQSSPRSWDVALVPFPGDFAPLPTLQETGAAQEAQWDFPPSLTVLTLAFSSLPLQKSAALSQQTI